MTFKSLKIKAPIWFLLSLLSKSHWTVSCLRWLNHHQSTIFLRSPVPVYTGVIFPEGFKPGHKRNHRTYTPRNDPWLHTRNAFYTERHYRGNSKLLHNIYISIRLGPSKRTLHGNPEQRAGPSTTGIEPNKYYTTCHAKPWNLLEIIYFDSLLSFILMPFVSNPSKLFTKEAFLLFFQDKWIPSKK